MKILAIVLGVGLAVALLAIGFLLFVKWVTAD